MLDRGWPQLYFRNMPVPSTFVRVISNTSIIYPSLLICFIVINDTHLFQILAWLFIQLDSFFIFYCINWIRFVLFTVIGLSMKTNAWLSKATTVSVTTRTNARSQKDSSATRLFVYASNVMKSKWKYLF